MRPFRFIATTFSSIIIVLLGASCASRQVTARLSEIESYIDSRPDSALAFGCSYQRKLRINDLVSYSDILVQSRRD